MCASFGIVHTKCVIIPLTLGLRSTSIAMKTHSLITLLCCCVLLLSGCVTPRYQPPLANEASGHPYRITLKSSVRDAWQKILSYFDAPGYTIEQISEDADEGVIRVAFQSDRIQDFVDCGRYRETDGHSIFSGAYTDYMQTYNKPQLNGLVKIQLQPVTAERTQVSVETDYTVSCNPDIWKFNSGGFSTVTSPRATPGTKPTRSCKPTHKVETQLLQYLAGNSY